MHSGFQNNFNQSFAIGPRFEGGFVKPKGQSPEFALAENARDRLMPRTARNQTFDLPDFVFGKRAAGLREQLRTIQLKRMRDEQPCIELRIIDAGGGRFGLPRVQFAIAEERQHTIEFSSSKKVLNLTGEPSSKVSD